MVLISHEELMTHQDGASWELNGGQHVEDPRKSLCQRLWDVLNSKTTNGIVVAITLFEALIIVGELLIDLRIIRDPYAASLCNNRTGTGDDGDTVDLLFHSSRPLRFAKDVLAYASIALLAFFLFEILLRILTGKGHYLRQTSELCDGAVVILAFSLDLAFLVTETDGGGDGKVAVVLIILFRLWRISRLVQSIVHEAKREMGHIINAYKRDKIQAEHKVEILILKVEDLEHEVAYLKEKLKKTEKEAATQKKRKGRDAGSDGFEDAPHGSSKPSSPRDATPWKSVPVLSFAALPSPSTPSHRSHGLGPASPRHASHPTGLHSPLAASPATKSKSPRRRRSQEAAELQEFVKSTVDRIVQSATSVELDTITEEGTREPGTTSGTKRDDDRHEDDSTPDATSATTDEERTDREPTAPESPSHRPSAREKGEAERGPSDREEDAAAPADELDELSEIERVKKVEFNSIEDSMDIPVTAL